MKIHGVYQKVVVAMIATVTALVMLAVPAKAEDGGYPYANDPTCATNNCVADEWGFYKRECTSFVAWKLNAANGLSFRNDGYGNAVDWNTIAAAKGYAVNNSPAIGAVAWWSFGHVAWVKSVSDDGQTVSLEEYNYDYAGNYHQREARTDSIGSFIHFKDIAPTIPATPAEPIVPMVPWVFEDIEGSGSSLSTRDGDIGRTPTAIEFKDQFYVFYHDAGMQDLRVAYTTPQWVFDTIDGSGGDNRTDRNVGLTPTAAVYNGNLHVFYYDATWGNLRHAWSNDGRRWEINNLDGDIGSIGRHDGNIGQTPTAVVQDNQLHVFYYDADNGDLLHAQLADNKWGFDTLDGSGSSTSKQEASVGQDPVAIDYSGSLQVFYYDSSNGNLRHAWTDNKGWNFENLDGDIGSIGKLEGDIGRSPSVVNDNGNLHVFYYDATRGDLRHMWTSLSVGWQSESLEGSGGSITGYDGDVGAMTTATIANSTLQVFTYEAGNGGNLRHLFNDGSGWHTENLDGIGGEPTGRSNNDVGYDPVATAFKGSLQLFYYDATSGNLRHALPK